MKHLKMIAAVAMTAMVALVVLGAGSASATTLEVKGVAKNEPVTLVGSMTPGTSAILGRTDGSLANTCTTLEMEGSAVSPFSAPSVTGSGKALAFGNCTRPVTAHKTGLIHVEHIAGTTNGTVISSGAEITVGSPFGTINCRTGAATHLGVVTGTPTGHATLHVNAVINCGFLVPSATLKSAWTITSPTGVGAVA
jgi:hypothetical protein